RIAEVVRDKKVEGVSDLRDESDRDGVRIVIELKRDATPEVVLNQLYKFTSLRTTFPANMLALDGGRPRLMGLKELLQAFIRFREDVITRRTRFELNAARDRAHVLVGLAIAVANIDEVIELIRRAPDPPTAREQLMARAWPAHDVKPLIELIDEPGRGVAADGTYRLSEIQARAILDLRLQRLTGLERDKIAEELGEVAKQISGFLELLASRPKLYALMRQELVEVRDAYATPRRTEIVEIEDETDIEDLIEREDMVVTVTQGGYVKRVPVAAYRAQRRGGRGRAGMSTKDDDVVSTVFVGSTHAPVLFFTSRGLVHRLKLWRLPQGAPQARGKAFVNLLPLQEGETITALMPLPEDETTWGDLQVMFATARGNVRRNQLSDFESIQRGGKTAMKFEGDDAGDRLIAVQICRDDQDVLLATRNGRAIRFPVDKVRVFAGRSSVGVRGVRLLGDDEVISMTLIDSGKDVTSAEREAYVRQMRALRAAENGVEDEDSNGHEPQAEAEGENGVEAAESAPAVETLSEERLRELEGREEFILTATSDGFGKRTSAYSFRVTGRGGQGVALIALTEGAEVVAMFPVRPLDQIMLASDGGMVVRIPVEGIRIMGRSGRGVRLADVREGERIASVSRIADDSGEDAEGEGEDEGEPG
ncbi:MAG: DNA gyrase C-terminal beta-propeller domain-containing protein, partial [Reyranellaceae bacterium]